MTTTTMPVTIQAVAVLWPWARRTPARISSTGGNYPRSAFPQQPLQAVERLRLGLPIRQRRGSNLSAAPASLCSVGVKRLTDDSQPTCIREDRAMVDWRPSDCGEWEAKPDSYAGDATLVIDAWPVLDLNDPARF
jgi:hypothetical protein